MKKELIWFAAGAALTSATLYFLQYNSKPIDCDVIAKAAKSDDDRGLTRKEKAAVAIIQDRIDIWGDDRDRSKPDYKRKAYKSCLTSFPY
jgi:hypothetical protein